MNISDILNFFPELQTERLVLRQITDEDLNEIYNIYSNELVTKFYNLDAFTNLDQAKRIVELSQKRFSEKTGIRWAICFKNNTEILGTCGINSFVPNGKAEIGYDLKPEYWGKGIMYEALTVMLNHGFNNLFIHRFEALVFVENESSMKLLKNHNFYQEGILRELAYIKDKYQDFYMMSLLKND